MKLDMVFVSNTGRYSRPYYDPSVRYRAFNLAEHFRRRGFRTTLLSQKMFEQHIDAFTEARLVLFHRPNLSEAVMKYIMKQEEQQTLIADYDDLVFDVRSAGDTPAVLDRDEDLNRIAKSLAGNAEMGSMFTKRTASTVPLAEEATRIMGGGTTVIHNGLDPAYLDVANHIFKARRFAKPEFEIGYFSGTASHNSDLKMVAPQIADFMFEHANARLLLVGPVALPSELEGVSDRVIRESVQSFHVMPHLIAKCRKVLGPLLSTQFTRCKSGLKFFEVGVLGVQVAATPIPDIDRFESPLLFKCRTPGDWAEALRAPALGANQVQDAVHKLRDDAAFTHQAKLWENTFLEAV